MRLFNYKANINQQITISKLQIYSLRLLIMYTCRDGFPAKYNHKNREKSQGYGQMDKLAF